MSYHTDCEDPKEHLEGWAHVSSLVTKVVFNSEEEKKEYEKREKQIKDAEFLCRSYDCQRTEKLRREVRGRYLFTNDFDVRLMTGKALGYSRIRIEWTEFWKSKRK